MMFTWCFVITKPEQLLFYSQHPLHWPGIITWFLGGITNSNCEPAASEGTRSLKAPVSPSGERVLIPDLVPQDYFFPVSTYSAGIFL